MTIEEYKSLKNDSLHGFSQGLNLTKLAKMTSSSTDKGQSKIDALLAPSEYRECLILKDYLDKAVRSGQIKMYSHIPNETFTKYWSVKLKNKAIGVKPGVPDYLIVTQTEVVFIEMKNITGGTVSKFQKSWLEGLNAVGIKAVVCYGAEDAIEFLSSLLKVKDSPVRLQDVLN